ncbi:hypothetical protein PUN28_016291 [Cardiocondyla obscurior]|uniref:Secreted protein n=1 Tax=Cardiocondyla obscurior TaxID=286306 RepID=A0AAW2ERU2_9HYME
MYIFFFALRWEIKFYIVFVFLTLPSSSALVLQRVKITRNILKRTLYWTRRKIPQFGRLKQFISFLAVY